MVLRIGLIALAQWVLQNSWVQMLAAAYLFWLFISHLIERNGVDDDGNSSVVDAPKRNLVQTVVLLGLTDLAFSIDSVAAAVAVSDQLVLISTGAVSELWRCDSPPPRLSAGSMNSQGWKQLDFIGGFCGSETADSCCFRP